MDHDTDAGVQHGQPDAARKSTVSSRTGSTAVYVTLIVDAESFRKLIYGRATFISGFCVFSVAPRQVRRVAGSSGDSHTESALVTRNGSLASVVPGKW